MGKIGKTVEYKGIKMNKSITYSLTSFISSDVARSVGAFAFVLKWLMFAMLRRLRNSCPSMGSVLQRRVPFVLMRSGTSKGPYFLRSDLPVGRGNVLPIIF
jgi:hypothetical protein